MKTKISYFIIGVLFSIALAVVLSQVLKRKIKTIELTDKNQKELILNETYLMNVLKIDSLNLLKFDTKDTIKLDVTRDENVIVSQFATWCSPCLREMKSYVELNKNVNNLRLYFISEEKDGVLDKFIKKYPIFQKYIYRDVHSNLQYSSLPSSYLYLKGRFSFFHGEASKWNNKRNIDFLNSKK